MPRSGGVYSLPAGTNVSAGNTIESSWANSLTQDLEQDANTDRPIVAGGTGASSAVAAMDNLFAQSSSIASASTTDLSTATGNYVNITGTTTITAFGSVSSGSIRILKFAGALTLTHNATSLILPGGSNITTAAGDVFGFVSEGSGNWRCIFVPGIDLSAVAQDIVPDGDGTRDLGSNSNAFAETHTDSLHLPEGSAPSTAASQGALYTKDSGGQPELFYREESDGDEVQFSKDGKINVPFTESFESSDQTITSGGSLTLAHGLSAEPQFVYVLVECQSAEFGYSVGDKMTIGTSFGLSASAAAYGVTITADSTNVYCRYGAESNVFLVMDKSDGSRADLTNASWKMIVRAWV